MRSKHLLVLALSLVAYADGQSLAAPASAPATPAPVSYSQPTHPSMPPRRVGDCVTYALLDNKCTADWYQCSDNGVKGRCVRMWNDCCSLPGNPARTTIVTSPQTP
jgi:hypothetical protein